jgi:hypothetical protein
MAIPSAASSRRSSPGARSQPRWRQHAAVFRGVLPLLLSSLKAGFPVLGNTANRHRGFPSRGSTPHRRLKLEPW